MRWRQGSDALNSSFSSLLQAFTSAIYLVSTVLAVRWSGVINAAIDVLKVIAQWRRDSPADPSSDTDLTDALTQLQENIEILQQQLDAMRAESSWAAARKVGDE